LFAVESDRLRVGRISAQRISADSQSVQRRISPVAIFALRFKWIFALRGSSSLDLDVWAAAIARSRASRLKPLPQNRLSLAREVSPSILHNPVRECLPHHARTQRNAPANVARFIRQPIDFPIAYVSPETGKQYLVVSAGIT
jgi:hypothetical protein